MSGESQNNEAAVAAPVEGNTAVPDAVENGTPGEPETPKTFTQEELDRIVSAEKAKAERKARREFAQQAQERPVAVEVPKPEQFKTPDEYVEALADYKADRKIAQQKATEQQTKVVSVFEERVDQAREKYSDFDAVAFSENVRITDAMAEVIQESEIGPEVAYHLGKNPDEARRIAGLPPLAQAREIGKIEASLSANPPAKKVTSAPEPIKPVGSRAANPAVDPSDPRSDKSFSDAEWIKARNEQLRSKR